MPMPDEKAIPVSVKTFAAAPAGMGIVKKIEAPAVGLEAELWKHSFRMDAALL